MNEMECFRIDESGYTGFVLLDSEQRFQGAAAIAISDDDAARLIHEHFPRLQAPELKCRVLSRRPGNHERLLALQRDLLGHRGAKAPERYTHLSDHPLKSAAERISDEIARHLGEAMALPAANDAIEADPFEIFWAPEPEAETHPSDPVLGAIIRTDWLDTLAAATRLGFTVGTMQTYRWMGTGPAYRKIGRRVVYSADALAVWQKAHASSKISHAP